LIKKNSLLSYIVIQSQIEKKQKSCPVKAKEERIGNYTKIYSTM
jgi:hypothetical protein